MTGLPSYFTDPEDGADWFAARREAIDHILAAVAWSPWSPRLVLRGDVLMRAWFDECVPEPDSVEFFVRLELWQRDEPRVREMLDDLLADTVARSRQPGSTVVIDRPLCEHDTIGESGYVRGPFRAQLILSWRGHGHVGTVDLDFVYEEPLPDRPVPTPIPRASIPGRPLVLLAASQRQSLAWKIAQLVAESGRISVSPYEEVSEEALEEGYPPAQDYHRPGPLGRALYEAVLLAERSPLPLDLFERTLGLRNILVSAPDAEVHLLVQIANDVDWNAFADEHPALAGAHEQFLWRFVAALTPTFASGPTQLLSLLSEHCQHELPVLRDVLDSGGMADVARWFTDSGHSLAECIVLTHELHARS